MAKRKAYLGTVTLDGEGRKLVQRINKAVRLLAAPGRPMNNSALVVLSLDHFTKHVIDDSEHTVGEAPTETAAKGA